MALLTVIIVSCFLSTGLACNGYEAKNLKIEECNGKSGLLKFENLVPVLKDDCTVVVKGCIVVLKQIDWGNGTYKAERKAKMGMPIKFHGKKDLCKVLEDSKSSPEISMVFNMFALDQKCPLKAGKICGNPKGVSVAKYKDQIKMMQGDYESIIEGTGNAGPLCIKMGMSVVPKGGSVGGMGMPTMG